MTVVSSIHRRYNSGRGIWPVCRSQTRSRRGESICYHPVSIMPRCLEAKTLQEDCLQQLCLQRFSSRLPVANSWAGRAPIFQIRRASRARWRKTSPARTARNMWSVRYLRCHQRTAALEQPVEGQRSAQFKWANRFESCDRSRYFFIEQVKHSIVEPCEYTSGRFAYYKHKTSLPAGAESVCCFSSFDDVACCFCGFCSISNVIEYYEPSPYSDH